MDEVKWYESCPLESIKNIIKDNINTASRSFVAIGYYLKNVRDRKLYLQDGYQSIWEFAQAEFGIGKSSASRFMAINDRFSKDGNSPILLEQYKDFSSSKLSEMLTMSDEQLEQVTLTTTVAEIREIKNHEEVVATSQQEVEKEFKECKFGGGGCNLFTNPNTCTGESRCNSNFIEYSEEDINPYDAKKPEVGTVVFDVSGNGKITRFEVTSKYCSFSERYFTVKDKFGVIHNLSAESEHWHYSKDEAKKDTWYHEKKPNTLGLVSNIPASVNDTAEIVNDILISSNGEDGSIVHERECSNCNYNDMTLEEFKVINPDGGFPCNECDDKLSHWIPKIEMTDDEFEQVDTVEADIIQTVPEEDKNQEVIDPESYTFQDIRDELNKLIEYVGMYRKNNDTAPGRRKAKMRLDAIALLDEEMRKLKEEEQPDNEPIVKKMARFAMKYFEQKDYENTDLYLFNARKELADNYEYDRASYPDYINDNKKPQPELPKLKNNDQRKEWIDNYTSWPVWIDLPQTGEKFYRYDLSDKVAIVIKVSRKHAWEIYKEIKDYEYAAEQYYLIGIKSEWQSSKSVYKEDNTRTFYECNTNKSALVEYLKEFQKKGV